MLFLQLFSCSGASGALVLLGFQAVASGKADVMVLSLRIEDLLSDTSLWCTFTLLTLLSSLINPGKDLLTLVSIFPVKIPPWTAFPLCLSLYTWAAPLNCVFSANGSIYGDSKTLISRLNFLPEFWPSIHSFIQKVFIDRLHYTGSALGTGHITRWTRLTLMESLSIF